MKKLIRRTVANKTASRIIIFIFLILVVFIVYVLHGIFNNVQKMSDVEDVTYFPSYPAINAQGKDLEQIKRGEYLVKAGDCIACHTNTLKKGPAFAGGLPMQTPFGTIYTTNITPDKETGIGHWTEEQFIKAMREGISPSGHYYYPAFPYIYFNKVAIEDLKAIKAYLDAIPPVHQKNQKNNMVFPFNIRLLQLPWRLMFFNSRSEGTFEHDPERSPLWNRGAYLSQGLGHCAMCHSPSYHIITTSLPLGAPIRKYDLTGAKIQGFLAPNITSANLATVSEEEIVEVFTQDKMIGGGKVEGPMLEVNHDSLRYLNHNDLLGIATYLKSVVSKSPPRPTGKKLGKGLYDIYCSGCHQSGAGGAPKYGDANSWSTVTSGGMDKVYKNAIVGIGSMPAKGTCFTCSDDEVKAAVDYMLDSVKGKRVSTGVKTKKLTLDDGQRIYQENCSVCHDTHFKNAPKPGDQIVWKPMVEAGFLVTLENVIKGKNHPPHGACPTCTDAEIKAAVKYMMQVSAPDKDYSLW